jgi:hypothetical protein
MHRRCLAVMIAINCLVVILGAAQAPGASSSGGYRHAWAALALAISN